MALNSSFDYFVPLYLNWPITVKSVKESTLTSLSRTWVGKRTTAVCICAPWQPRSQSTAAPWGSWWPAQCTRAQLLCFPRASPSASRPRVACTEIDLYLIHLEILANCNRPLARQTLYNYLHKTILNSFKCIIAFYWSNTNVWISLGGNLYTSADRKFRTSVTISSQHFLTYYIKGRDT